MHSSNSRLALLWLVSAFGAVAVARYEAHTHPPAAQLAQELVALWPAGTLERPRIGRVSPVATAATVQIHLPRDR